jgi:hypothetical protein
MSLQLLAKQMEAKGRKGDSMLVHMTPKEVAALQKMAESAGGSLSVNPETGLVEAFSLRNLLPAIVGGALVASGVGMPLAIAGGALTGGIQAKRDDKDFLTGALMGGLSAYGGAGLAGGLGVAGAAGAGAGAAGATAAPMTAAQGLSQAGQGIGALGSEAGRTAFMQGVGGMGGLAKAAGAVAAPMLTEEQKMAEAPVDDEMYSYTFDPGRTYAERDPSATSAGREYFRSSYSPMRRIRASEYPVYAAQGGLMSLAEGGETAAPTADEVAAPTASEAALAYLMGERSSSAPARSPLIDAQMMPAPMGQAPVVGSDNMYAFDPATGTFLRNPNIPGASTSGSPVGTSFSGSGGDSNQEMSQQTKDFFDREAPAQREARMGEVSNLFSLGPVGAFANAVTGSGLPGRAPDFGTLFGTGDAYKNLGYDYYQGEGGTNLPSGLSYAEAVGMGGDYGYSGYSGGGDGGDGPDGWKNGGLLGLAKGGMASGGFVVPADVVSALGNGSTDAGLRKLSAMMGDVKPIKGKGDGLSDSIPTNIDGKQPARVADGEAYIDPKTVKRLGGAKKLYAMMDKVRAQAHGKTTQQRKVNPGKVMA